MIAAGLIKTVRDERPLVADLARTLSLAASIDVALVRQIRLLRFALSDVTTEADLWTSPLVQARTGGEITLRNDVQELFWTELRANRVELERSWRALCEVRPLGRPLRDLEEDLTYYALRNDLGRVDDALGTVVRAMLDDPARRRDLSAWAARALARLPKNVLTCEAARILGTVAAAWVATPARIAALTPKPESLPVVERLIDEGKRTWFAIQRTGDSLQVGIGLPLPNVLIDVPVASPILIIDHDQTYRLALDGVTTIPVQTAQVTVGTTDGRRWLLGPTQAVPNLNAVMQLVGDRERLVYLIAQQLAVTTARRMLQGDRLEVEFGTSRIAATLIAADDDEDIALLRLAEPAMTAPLVWTENVHPGQFWQAFEDPPGRHPTKVDPGEDKDSAVVTMSVTPSWSGAIVSGWPNITLATGDTSRITSKAPRPGTPIFVGDRMIGHVRADQQSSELTEITPTRSIAAFVNANERDAWKRPWCMLVKARDYEAADTLAKELKQLSTSRTRVLLPIVSDEPLTDVDIDFAAALTQQQALIDLLPLPAYVLTPVLRCMLRYYSSEIEALELVQKIGLRPSDLPLGISARELWMHILQQANVRGVMRNLVQAIRREFAPDRSDVDLLDALLLQGERSVRLVGVNVPFDVVASRPLDPGVEIRRYDSIGEAVDSLRQEIADSEQPPPPPTNARVYINSRRSEDAPDELQLQGAANIQKNDVVVLFVGEDRRRWPAALYQVIGGRRMIEQAQLQSSPATSAELQCRLLLRFRKPIDDKFERHADEIGRLANSTSQRDTRNLNIHERLLALLWQLYERQGRELEQYLGAPAFKTLPVLLQLPERISLAGLLGTEYAVDDDGIRRLRTQRWSAHDVSIVLEGYEFLANPLSLRIKIAERPVEQPRPEFSGTISGSVVPPADKQRFFEACGQAFALFGTLGREGSSDWDLELVVDRLPSQTSAWALRRGVQFAMQILAHMDSFTARVPSHFVVKGSGQRDVAEVQRRVRETSDHQVISIDPEAELIRVLVSDQRDDVLRVIAEAAGGVIESEITKREHGDPLATRFGTVEQRHGRSIKIEYGELAAFLSVQATDDRPVRGYVTFYYPIPTRIDVGIGAERVRASGGVARCKIPLFDGPYSVGAVIEDEALALEGLLTMRTVLPGTEGEFDP